MKTCILLCTLLSGCANTRYGVAYEDPDGHRFEVTVQTGKEVVPAK